MTTSPRTAWAEQPLPPLNASSVGQALGQRMRLLHGQLLELVPAVDRIACVLYDQRDDLLRTFVHSTRSGEAIKGYEFRLSDSTSLAELAASGHNRVIDEIAEAVHPVRACGNDGNAR